MIRSVVASGTESSVETLHDLARAFTAAGQAQPFLGVEWRGRMDRSIPIEWNRTNQREHSHLGLVALLCALLLAVPLTVLWSAHHPGAAPLCIFYGAFSVLVIGASATDPSPFQSLLATAALAIAPASLFHLALCFPRDRPALATTPALAFVPYIGAAFLVAFGWHALAVNPSNWAAYLYFVLGIAGLAWVVPVVSSGYAMIESRSELERSRARIFIVGALALPILPGLWLAGESPGPAELSVAYLWSGAALLPMPIALAISRYDLFDLGLDARRFVAFSLLAGAGTLCIALGTTAAFWAFGIPRPGAIPLLAGALLGFAVLEPLRRRLPTAINCLVNPRAVELMEATARFTQGAVQGLDEDGVAERLGHFARGNVGASSVAVFLAHDGVMRLAHCSGDSHLATMKIVDELQSFGLPAHWRRTEELRFAERLKSYGIEVVAPIEPEPEPLGIVFLGRPAHGGTYTSLGLDALAGAAAIAGVAIRASRTEAAQMANEGDAAFGRALIAIAHDTGKDLGWIRRLLQRISANRTKPLEITRDTGRALELVDHSIRAMGQLVRSRPNASQSPDATLRTLLDLATRRAEALHGRAPILTTPDVAVQCVTLPIHTSHIIGNLLDNALAASDPRSVVRLGATERDGSIVITVTDSGTGIPREIFERVFEPGFTTKGSEGGLGVGLTAARQLAEIQGGTLCLEPAARGGTKAIVTLPAGGRREELDRRIA